MFEYLNELTAHLPKKQKNKMQKENLNLKVGSIISKLNGKNGLSKLDNYSLGNRVTINNISSAMNYIKELADFMPESIATNLLKTKIVKINRELSLNNG